MLDPETRTELRSLAKDTADLVARHLVMTGRWLDEDPAAALAHARAARALAGRVGAVREAAGLAAYHAGEWADALSEMRTARRITGRAEHLHVMADCERALGRPDRALTYADDPAVSALPQELRVELVIVLAGARIDMAQPAAAVVLLQDPARRTTATRPWAARLWYAYADALLASGRAGEARDWFSRVADLDTDGQTDAVDRLLDLDGVVLEEAVEADRTGLENVGLADDRAGLGGVADAVQPGEGPSESAVAPGVSVGSPRASAADAADGDEVPSVGAADAADGAGGGAEQAPAVDAERHLGDGGGEPAARAGGQAAAHGDSAAPSVDFRSA